MRACDFHIVSECMPIWVAPDIVNDRPVSILAVKKTLQEIPLREYCLQHFGKVQNTAYAAVKSYRLKSYASNNGIAKSKPNSQHLEKWLTRPQLFFTRSDNGYSTF